MAVRTIATTAPVGGSPVTQPNPTGNQSDGYVVTQGGPNPPSTASVPDALAAAQPFNDVVE